MTSAKIFLIVCILRLVKENLKCFQLFLAEGEAEDEELSANQFSCGQCMQSGKMAAQGASASNGYIETALDDVFEDYGPIDVENFIDSAFNYALGGEEEMYSSNHVETQLIARSKVDVDNMQDGCLTTLHGFAYGTHTQINLDRTISLTPPQGETGNDVVCSNCRRVLEKENLDQFRTFSGSEVNSKTTPFKTQDKTKCEIDVRGG